MSARFLVLFLAAAGVACSGSHEFDRVVREVEHHYGVKQTHIPLMGLANFVVKVARPAGTSGFHLAVFEDLPPADDNGDLDHFMSEFSAGRLHPMVVTRDRRIGEFTYILTGEAGKSTQVLIATFERREATIIEVTVNMETLMQMIHSPENARSMFGDRHNDGDGGR